MNVSPRLIRFGRTLVTRSIPHAVHRRGARRYRAAVVKLDRLGDFVLAVSAIRSVLERFGEAETILVLSPAPAALAAVEFPDTPQIVLPAAVGHKRLWFAARSARAVFRQIAAAEVVSLRHQRWDWDELVLAWLRPARIHVLDDPISARFSADRKTFEGDAMNHVAFAVPPSTDATGSDEVVCREIQRHAALLTAVLPRPIEPLQLRPEFHRINAGESEPFVLIAPFASAPIRDFPAPALQSAAREVASRMKLPIHLCGDASQQPRLEALAGVWRREQFADVRCCPPMSAVDFARAVAAARLVVTVETATAHLATAFDRPAVIALGGGHYGEFAPWTRSPRQVWLTSPIDCAGCNWACIHPEPYCLSRVTGDEVVRAIRTVATASALP